MRQRLILPVIALLIVFATSAEGADFQKAFNAHRIGDFATALREFKPLAEQGNAKAQYFLGEMYGKGQGVVRNRNKAAKWTADAAVQGHTNAQYSLGRMYARGVGVNQSYSEAARWYRKAAEQGHAIAQSRLSKLVARLRPDQLRLSRSEVRSLLLGSTEVGVLRRPSRPAEEGNSGQTYKAYYHDDNTVWYKLDASEDIKRWEWKIMETGVLCRGPELSPGLAWCRAITPDGVGGFKAVGFRTGNLRYQFKVKKGLFGLPEHLLE